MWAKVFAALVVSVAVTAIGVFYAAPGAVADLALSDGTSVAESGCCAKRNAVACSTAVDSSYPVTESVSVPTQALDPAATANIGVRVCPTDAFAACSGGVTLASGRSSKTADFNCCAE